MKKSEVDDLKQFINKDFRQSVNEDFKDFVNNDFRGSITKDLKEFINTDFRNSLFEDIKQFVNTDFRHSFFDDIKQFINTDFRNSFFDDVKQFVTATVSQSEASLANRFDIKIDGLDKKMGDGFAGVADAIESLHDIVDKNQSKANRRLTRLENRFA